MAKREKFLQFCTPHGATVRLHPQQIRIPWAYNTYHRDSQKFKVKFDLGKLGIQSNNV